MPTNRGSQHKVTVIAETAFGVTPATPTMLEMPTVDLQYTGKNGVMRSAQLRSHPFTDRLLKGMFTHDVVAKFELQPGVHDPLLQTMFGGTIASKTLKFADNLSSLSVESGWSNVSLFDQFAGMYFSKMDFSAGASDTAPIAITLTGAAKIGALDQAVTLATTVTAASTTADPYVSWDALFTIGGTPRPVTTFAFSATRTVNPLNVLGSRLMREAVPDQVSITGSFTVPYEDNLESTRFTAFADMDLLIKCQSLDTATFRAFEMPRAKQLQFGKQVNIRGAIMQVINYEAYYDTSSQTALIMTTQ